MCINLCIQVCCVKSTGLQQPNSGFMGKLDLPGQNLYPSTIHPFMPLIVSAQIDLPLLELLFPCKLLLSKFDFVTFSRSFSSCTSANEIYFQLKTHLTFCSEMKKPQISLATYLQSFLVLLHVTIFVIVGKLFGMHPHLLHNSQQ